MSAALKVRGPTARAADRPGMRLRLAARGLDATTLLVLPALLFILALFVYPAIYGVVLSLHPTHGRWFLANYAKFFSVPYLYDTIFTTMWLSLPVALLSVVIAVPLALQVRRMRYQRLLTTILVVPITLGTVLTAQGLLGYLGPMGWFNRVLIALHLISTPMLLVHNYWGVFLSQMIAVFPFGFLLILSYVSGIDPSLEKAAAMLGAGPAARFRRVLLPLLASGLAITFCLAFVQAFSVFPSAVLVGAPAGPTRVISIAAYRAAYQQYDYSMGSAIALIMAAVQMIVVGIVFKLQTLFYRGPMTGGKG